MKHIVILGAGISGLTAAWTLQKKANFSISLYEKEKRVGGSIQTLNKEGFLFERGPRGFRSSGKGKKLLQLIDELGLNDKVLTTSKKGKKRYLLNEGKLERVSLFYLIKKGLLLSLLREPFRKKLFNEDETVFDFFSRRFNEKFSSTLIDPLMRGIFGGDAKALSMAASFPSIYEWEKKYGSFLKGAIFSEKESSHLLSFKGGMQTLPDTLKAKLEGKVSFHLGQFPTKITSKEGKILLHFQKETMTVDGVIAAIPAYELESLLDTSHDFLNQIPYLTLTTLNIGLEGNLLPIDGFGFLVPSKEHPDFLGMTFDHHIFPSLNQGDKTRLCLIFKGEKGEETISFAKELLKKLFSIHAPIHTYDLHSAIKAVPQYSLGHVKRKESFSIPALYPCGNYVEGISLIDCIDQATRTAENILFNS